MAEIIKKKQKKMRVRGGGMCGYKKARIAPGLKFQA
jgi:hypothetical protein